MENAASRRVEEPAVGSANYVGSAPLSGDEHLCRAFFRDETDGVLFTTANGEEVLDANEEACHILDRACEEVLGEGGAAIFDSSDPRLGAARAEQRRAGSFRGGCASCGGYLVEARRP